MSNLNTSLRLTSPASFQDDIINASGYRVVCPMNSIYLSGGILKESFEKKVQELQTEFKDRVAIYFFNNFGDGNFGFAQDNNLVDCPLMIMYYEGEVVGKLKGDYGIVGTRDVGYRSVEPLKQFIISNISE